MAAHLRILRDPVALARAAAEEFVLLSRAAIEASGRFAAALSGGTTPAAAYALLAEPEFRARVDWQRVKLFQVDERLVPDTHPDSNARMIHAALASKVALPPGGFERFWREDEDPEAVAAGGERRLRDWFGLAAGEIPRFDLIVLGMGTDGHTASLFPDSKALAETTRLVVPVPAEAERVGRVTLTLPVINNAAAAVFLVSGKAKAGTLRSVLGGDPAGAALPAARVQPGGHPPLWLVDAEAASARESWS